MSRRALPTMLAMVAMLVAGCGDSDEATAGVPRSFFGVAPQGPVSAAEFARMGQGAVGSYHLLLNWGRVEFASGSYDWSLYDEIMTQLAINGIQPVPYVFGTPAFISSNPSTPPVRDPSDFQDWLDFLQAAALRYGPDGTFWRSFVLTHPGIEPRPVEIWEIWNEINGPAFWAPKPNPGEYATLLRRSAAVLRQVDPEAQTMVGGMFATPSSPKAIRSFDYLKSLYERKGVAEATDLVAIHPYGPDIKSVSKQMSKTYRVMRHGGDGSARMFVTELGWGSDPTIGSELSKRPKVQAKLLKQGFQLMVTNRDRWNVEGVFWYTWRDPSDPVGICDWCLSAGLFDRDLDPRPAWTEFTQMTGGQP